jgi:plastocyanin
MKTVIAILLALAVLTGFSQANAARIEVDIHNFAFTPHGEHISPGDTIMWKNLDPYTHISASDNSVWYSGPLTQNQTYSFAFPNPGTFPYHCAIHTTMHDTIFVGPQTGIGETTPTPKEFELSYNYPNPFNAQTLIRYSIPSASHVNIEIYNVLGQKIDDLLDSDQAAGDHEITWNASDQSSGVFFYRVNVDGNTKTGRMTLLK